VIRVLLDLSSPALRAGLRALLSSDRTIKIINDSLDEDMAADVMITSAAHVSFTAASTQLSASRDLDSAPSAAILYLSEDPLNVREMTRSARAWGILPPESSAEELSAAVHALSQGLVVGTSALLFESESDPPEGSRGPLTERETEVLDLLSKGLANKQIAMQLGISEHTVKFHVSSIYQKLGVTNRTEAVRAGLRGGWVTL
jgi:DNA-binding NarL/FixJ family response regulator